MDISKLWQIRRRSARCRAWASAGMRRTPRRRALEADPHRSALARAGLPGLSGPWLVPGHRCGCRRSCRREAVSVSGRGQARATGYSSTARRRTHSRIHWPQRLTYTDITPYVVAGRQNEIVLRVEPGERNRWRPAAWPGRDQRCRATPADLLRSVESAAGRDFHARPARTADAARGWTSGGSMAAAVPSTCPASTSSYGPTRSSSTTRSSKPASADSSSAATATGAASAIRPSSPATPTRSGRYSPTRSRSRPAAATCWFPTSVMTSAASTAAKIDFDLYARWIEFGTFSPILRMHSAHENPREGNLRMPWIYGDAGHRLDEEVLHAAHATAPLPLYLHLAGAPRVHADPAAAVPAATRSSKRRTVTRTSICSARRCWSRRSLDPSGDQTIYLPPGRVDRLLQRQALRTAAAPSPPTTRWMRPRCSCAKARSFPSSASATNPGCAPARPAHPQCVRRRRRAASISTRTTESRSPTVKVNTP